MDRIFVNRSHGLGAQVESLENTKGGKSIDKRASGGMNGFIYLCTGDSCLENSTLYAKGTEDIAENHVICAQYKCPDFHPHIPRLLENVTIPEKTISEVDIMTRPPWHEYEGFHPPARLYIQPRYNKASQATNVGQLASSDSPSCREIFKGADSGWNAVGRGKRCPTSSTQNFESSRGTCAENNINLVPLGSSLGRGSSGRGNGYTESSWNKNSGSYIPQENGCKIESIGPSSVGRGRAVSNSSQGNWRANGSYTALTSGGGSGTNGRTNMSYPIVSSGRSSETYSRANGSYTTFNSGRGSETNWRANVSYTTLNSRRGSETNRRANGSYRILSSGQGRTASSGHFWPSRNDLDA